MSRPESTYSAVPTPGETHVNRDQSFNPITTDFAESNLDHHISPVDQSMPTAPAVGALSDGTPAVEDGAPGGDRAASTATTAVQASAPARSNTLRKKGSVRRTTSLKRSNSKRSMTAGSLAGHGSAAHDKEYNSAYSTPVPTQGAPTEILANRFQAWRQLLKSLIAYFREIQASYEMRAKATHKIQGVMASITNPSVFMKEHGLGEATKILDEYHKRSVAEANKSREIEEDVIGALTGLRSDLGQKIKEIKSLSSDFKNSVDKEKENTTREVEKLQESIQSSERDDGSATGKNDPFVIKLGVDRAVEKQIDEENYLHRAYLNLESSGRELEAIVVGEIQKAYNALAGILKREGDDAYTAVESLRSGPISLAKDAEWLAFVENDPHFIDPNLPLRRIEDIEYPGKHHPSAVEVRAGMLERKSKYLKSYTPGWYVLSPTHLHEFKSADKIYSQPPVMSLYLPDQKLGSQSQPGSSSHKFMVKGKQSGNMHKGHNWVFRAESYDTMVAWFDDMRILTEKTGEERNAFVRKHARSFSSNSRRASVSSDGMEEDEADQVPYSADVASLPSQTQETKPQRPQPGGRFPSDFQVQRARGVSLGQDSVSSDADAESNAVMAGALPASGQLAHAQDGEDPYRLDGVTAGTMTVSSYNWDAKNDGEYFDRTPLPDIRKEEATATDGQPQQTFLGRELAGQSDPSALHDSLHGDGISPGAAGVVSATVGAAAVEEHQGDDRNIEAPQSTREVVVVPEKQDDAIGPHDAEPVAVARSIEPTSDQINTDSVMVKPAPINELGGLESEGARETGEILPKVVRHNTEMSVSQLHVPGEFP